jgi:hypothetical protein
MYEWFQRGSHKVRQNDTAFFVCGALGILLFLACLQQIMLRSAGWRVPLWAVWTGLGLLAGGFLGVIVGGIGFNIAVSYPWSAFFGILVTTFTWGSVLGILQFIAVQGSSRQQIFWMFASGLAMSAAGATIFLLPGFPFFGLNQLILNATVLGGCYGSITGAALIYLLAREQRSHRRASGPSSE